MAAEINEAARKLFSRARARHGPCDVARRDAAKALLACVIESAKAAGCVARDDGSSTFTLHAPDLGVGRISIDDGRLIVASGEVAPSSWEPVPLEWDPESAALVSTEEDDSLHPIPGGRRTYLDPVEAVAGHLVRVIESAKTATDG